MKHKKLLAILTLVCFMFTLVPVAAFAEETTKNVIVVEKAEDFNKILTEATDAGSGNWTVKLLENTEYDMSKVTDWVPVTVNGYYGAGVVTIEGNGAVITGLKAPLFAGGFAGKSGIVIKDLTIADSKIVSTNTLGSGAFIETVDSMPTITLTNCHLLNSALTGSRTGGLIGWNSGYNNTNDGAVETHVTIENCSVVDCEITGNGTVGAIIGHAGANAWTYNTINNCTIKNNKLTSNDDSYRVGVVVGTANIGEVVISGITEEGNTLTQNNAGTEIARPVGQNDLYGRFSPSDGSGKLTVDDAQIIVPGGAVQIGGVTGPASVKDDNVTVLAGGKIGEVTVQGVDSITVPVDKTADVTVDDEGTITLPAGSSAVKDGNETKMKNGGTISKDGIITNVKVDSEIVDGDEEYTVTYGDTITLTVKVTTAQVTTFALEADMDEVVFYVNNGQTELGRAEVNYADEHKDKGTAILTYNTAEKGFSVGDNTITAVYGGSVNLNGSSNDTIKVTLEKKNVVVKANDQSVKQGNVMPDLTYTIDGLVSGDTFASPIITAEVANTNVPGKYSIAISGGTLTNEEYYTVTYNQGTLTITENEADPVYTGGSSGFTGKYNYPVTVIEPTNGEAQADKFSAVEGATVTITTEAEAGYGVYEVIVTDADGDRIPTTDLNNGQYTFTMPNSEAKVQVVYEPAITMVIDSVYINVFGKTIKNDVTPKIVDGRTVLPIRVVAEALGADVDWDPETQKLTITKGDTVIELFIGKYFAYVNGEVVELDVAPFIENSRTYLPVRFVSEYLGAIVNWDAATRIVAVIPE